MPRQSETSRSLKSRNRFENSFAADRFILQSMQLSRVSLLFLATTALSAAQSAEPAPAHAPVQQVWRMQDSGTTASLRGIDSVDGTVAWASGSEGTVLKTVDGGAHWQKCPVPDAATDGATLDFRGVEAWDSASAIVMSAGPGDKSRLYKTVDGCRTWTLLFKNPDSPDGFFDSFWLNTVYGQGMLLGDPVKGRFAVFQTEDGGISWKRDGSKDLALHGDLLAAFAASNSSIARSDERIFRGFVSGGKSGAVLYMRAYPPDFWKSWLHPSHSNLSDPPWVKSVIPLASGSEASGAFSIDYRKMPAPRSEAFLKHGAEADAGNWRFVAVGGDYTKPNESAGTAACSDDGGQHWYAADTPTHGYRSSVEWSSELNLWIAAGSNGSDISRDNGRTWLPLDNGNWNALSIPFIVGPKGRIARLDPGVLSPAK
jgi:photosystem II stability/assembly factor-like uncharacterized protein